MPDFIGNIQVPEITPSGTFPIVADYPHGRAHRPEVIVHQFGSANAKIEQRFLLGNGAKRFTVRKAFLRESDRIALRDFWESHYGPYGAFTYNAPNDDGDGNTPFTCRFANEPLSWEFLSDAISSLGVTLIEIPTSSPTYTLNQTVTRFPPQALKDALLSQVQEIIPLVKIQPRQAGYPAIYVSDRRCTIGAQLYQARLLEFDGISQSLGNEADEARFTFGNADRVLRDLVNDADLFRASIEFSLFHIGTGIQLDLWRGEVINWQMDTGPEFHVTASDGIYELNLPYPTRKAARFCWKDFNDGQNCPFATQSTGMDLAHFPDANPDFCDKGYETPSGCLAHGMKRFFGGILAEPQSVSIKIRDPKIRITSTSILNESIQDQVLAEIYTDMALPVPCMVAAGRDEGEFFNALGVVGEGPIGAYGSIVHRDETGHVTKVVRHTLDGQEHHGSPGPLGLREVKGTDPAGADHFFALGQSGQAHASDWRQASAGASNYKDNFAAGTAFLELKRHDPKGLQLSRPTDHEMIAVIAQGMGCWVWTGPGARTFQSGITNPVWIIVNILLRALGYRAGANLTTAQLNAAEGLFDVSAAVAAADICNLQVAPVITREQWIPVTEFVEDQATGELRQEVYYEKQKITQETQFKFRGILQDEKPLRDWIQEVLMNCLGYYSFAFGKLKLGIRVNSSAVEAFTEGNILFQSLRLAPIKPAFNRLIANFADLESQFSGYSLPVEDIDHAKLIGGATAPLRLTSTMNLAGATTKSQAGRVIATRLREELGGINASEWKRAREIGFKTTVLALNTEPGMVCSLTHPDMPNGLGEFRVTGWRLKPDYSIEIQGRTTTDGMYNLAIGPKPADVIADPVPEEFIPRLPKPDDWELAADPDGTLRLSFTFPRDANYLTGQLRLLEEIELLRVETILAAPLTAEATTVEVLSSEGFLVGEYVNIGQEILQIVGPGVKNAEPTSTTWEVARGQKLSEPRTAASGDSVYRLVEREFHFEFPPGYTLAREGLRQTERFKPGSVRILYASLEFFNVRVSSEPAELPFWAVWESEFGPGLFGSLPGLRVTSGGLATIQVPGPLATGDDLAPDLFLPAGLSIGIVSAKLREAATGQALLFRLDSHYSDGTVVEGGVAGIVAGATESGPIASGAKATVDTGNRAFRLVITQVGSTEPGEDLTVMFTF